MKLIKWILSHGVLIIIVVLVALGIYFRAELFPEYFAQHEPVAQPEVAAQPESKPKPTEPTPVVEQVAEEPAEVTEAPLAEEPAVAEPPPAVDVTAEAAPSALPSASATAAAVEDQPAKELAAAPPVETVASAAPATLAQPKPSPAEEAAVSPEPATESKPQAEVQAGAADALKLRSDARQAFWRGDYEQATAHYESLAALDPQDPNPYGELGNVYFGQGKWSEAAAAYLEAGRRLVAINRIGQAMHLQRIMVGLDAERAQELQRAIDEASGTAATNN